MERKGRGEKAIQTVGCYTPSEIVGYTESIESVMRTGRRVWLHISQMRSRFDSRNRFVGGLLVPRAHPEELRQHFLGPFLEDFHATRGVPYSCRSLSHGGVQCRIARRIKTRRVKTWRIKARGIKARGLGWSSARWRRGRRVARYCPHDRRHRRAQLGPRRRPYCANKIHRRAPWRAARGRVHTRASQPSGRP